MLNYDDLKKNVQYVGVFGNKVFKITKSDFGVVDIDLAHTEINPSSIRRATFYTMEVYNTPLFKALHVKI